MDRGGAMYARDRCAVLTAAVEMAEDGVCVTDRQGGLLHQNVALRRLIAAEAERRTLEQAIDDARHASVARADVWRLGTERCSHASGGADAAGSVTMTSGDWQRPSITLQVRTSGSEYRVRATTTDDAGAGRGESMVVVWVRRCRPRHLSLEALRERYRLTSREVRVASLIAARSGSREIAEALGISPHTARRHTEAVLRKLGVHSRADVRERLRG